VSALDDARLFDRDARPCWYVQIAGLPWRPYAGAAPPADPDYTDVEAISSVSRGGSTIEPDTGRVSHNAVTVIVGRASYGDGQALARALLRLRPEGADRRLLLLTSMDATSTAAVEVTTSNAAWPASGHIYVDDECIAYTGVAGDGTVGNRYRFTGITRGALGTLPTSHWVDDALGQQPWVVSDVVAWRTRPATLYLQMEGGSGWVEWLSGFIDQTPSGNTAAGIILRLVGWEALFDTEIGGDAKVCGLSHQRHLLTVGVADQMVMSQGWEAGHGYAQQVSTATASGSGSVKASTAQYDDVFDDGLAADHPRHPDITVRQATPIAQMNPTVLAADEFDVGGGPSANVAASEQVVNVTTFEATTATIDGSALGTEVLKRWPADYLQALTEVWAPGTNKGADGVWADCRLQESAPSFGGRPAMSIKLNSTLHASDLLVTWRGRDAGRSLAYPIRLIAPDVDPDWRGGPNGSQRLEWERTERVGRGAGAGTGRELFRIADLADAFRQCGEPVALLDALRAATGVAFWWSCTWDERGEERTTVFRGTISGASTEAGVTVGYRVEIEDPETIPSFGDWPGFGRCRIRPAAVWKGADWRRVLVEVLCSLEGAGVNGAYDVQPFGLGIPEGAVDAAQILSFPSPPGLGRVDITIDSARKVSEVFAGIFVAAGCVLQLALNPATGARQLRLVRVTRASKAEAVATLGADDWEPDEVPPETDDRIVNAWEIATKTADGRDVTDRWSDVSSIRAHRETRSQKIDLTEVRIDLAAEAASGAAALRSVYGQLSASYAWPRRLVSGGVRQPSMLHLDAGDVAIISCDDIVGYDGAEGATGIPARLLSVEHDVDGGSSRITFALDPADGRGWNSSLYVEAVIGLKTVRVAANHYTDTTTPAGATRRDLDKWAVGDDAVECPIGAWAGTVNTITGINTGTRQVTFASNHGLSAGDSIDPVVYDDAPAVQQDLAYLADDALELGGTPDPAGTYS